VYTTLKKLAKGIIPEKFLQKNEHFLRRIIASKYTGNKAQCNICDYKLKHFVTRANGDLLCPNCGSLSRTRRLYQTLTELPLNGKVLHFSPPKRFSSKLKDIKSIDYCTSDFAGEFEADYHYDITAISAVDNTFNTIICYHVLEHIENDIKAMKELYRILTPGGSTFIQTPFKQGDIYEDYSIISEEDRKVAFGQEDHVRIYSADVLNKRLQSVGFKTELVEFKNEANSYNGFKPETFIKATKQE
tara:strand:+ start:28799 stop:29533 length:735 start_codon:yes stop_codon:yes gene_type:complete